jgi:hypothetical protein
MIFFILRHGNSPPMDNQSKPFLPPFQAQLRGKRLRFSQYNIPMKNYTLPIIIERDADGFYVSCPPLQGCYTQGDTYD